MAVPVVAIVGRPNVGKSSLLNMLVGRRVAIVEPTAGVTRDRLQVACEYEEVYFDLVDTGGYGIVDRDDLSADVQRQIAHAVHEASLILFVVDGREGITPLDTEVADWLRGRPCPILLVANKIDTSDMRNELGELPRLGFGEPLPASALHRRGDKQIKSWIVQHLPTTGGEPPDARAVMKLAIVGLRNAGKSTFINALAGQERTIVSEIPGTTRDAIDVRFELHGQSFIAIDTAGLRKKSRIADDIEYYGFQRAEQSIRRADVVLMMMDATADVGRVDKQLARYIADHYKPCIQIVNKWDLAKEHATTDAYGEYLLQTMPMLEHAPVAFTSAIDGKNTQSVIDLAASLFKQARCRVSTGELNRAVTQIMSENLPAPSKGRRLPKILYATQVAVCPPSIVLFVDDPAHVTPGFERFLTHRLRDRLPFAEVPIRLIFRARHTARDIQKRHDRTTQR